MRLYFLICYFAITAMVTAQNPRINGPVIVNHGGTYEVPSPTIPTDMKSPFQVVFDIKSAPENPETENPYLATVARFLNMHVLAGKAAEQLQPVMVVHGNAAYGLLTNAAYQEKFGVENPNLPLLEALHEQGVPIILCGQTAMHRDIGEGKRYQEVNVALSAMTALIQYQNKGYALITL
ncbi:DsrE family protein [Altibacter sp. HG106]|uniref:DsrE family protein n=1 Tax=Altibacter sp. HG106 TaxID=3023937 RepID=UPI00234FC3F2|nr:DsrE family protein [Altibacter sp. HG106]MDC7993871.1 DsrE family protein [Altibacter sp. HG106]